jgi:hypothetical protein
MIPELIPCSSSTIRARGWEDSTLYVQFIGRNKPDSVYSYADVPQEIWTAWLRAASAGSWFAANIKGKYPTTKIQ